MYVIHLTRGVIRTDNVRLARFHARRGLRVTVTLFGVEHDFTP